DDFIEIKYEGYEFNQDTGEKIRDMVWEAEEVINWEAEDRKNKAVTGTVQVYKDAYFETMFYKTYIGPYDVEEDGTKKEYLYQLPCVNMRHFYVEYFSDLSQHPYYDTGKAAVVIAKYYEGAYVNGTVTFLGQSVDAQLAIQKNVRYHPEYTEAIDHDKASTDENGNFSLIAGAGASLILRRNYPQEIRPFEILNITFSGENDTELAPITDEDAMRKGSNYERTLNITIEPGVIEGYFYSDDDEDGNYNTSVDTPLQNINISIYDIGDIRAPVATAETDESGFYNASGLFPGFYYIRAEQNGYIIGEQLAEIYQFDNYYNISQLAHSAIKGKVTYEDEEISDASVSLTYKRMGLQGEVEERLFIGTVETDNNGDYEFSKTLIPGEYDLSVISQDSYYVAEEEISLQANETLEYNVPLYLKPVTVSGALTYNGAGVENVDVSFIPDPPEPQNNTAVEDFATSGENGNYVIDLAPGDYKVIVDYTEQATLVYDYEGILNVVIGGDSMSLDISLNKYSATVSGTTTYDGESIGIIELEFSPDAAASYNTALRAIVASDENGVYTAELNPGQYRLDAEGETFEEGGQNYTYKFTGTFTVTNDEIITGKTFNVVMVKTES
ncbi:MAG: carboxypeptidase regulatory-like domain-containing protein, partial [Thermoplasmatales archaeon]|nr:carboxypeptidase regulatory-like domain-containing protein [Thermoplasmatales archaeon]